MSKVSDVGIQELLDRQKCYDVLTRYCRAPDRADVALMKSVYRDDADDEHGVFTGNAQEFAEFIIREIQVWFEVTMHAICNIHREYYGDTMCTGSCLIAYHKVKADKEKVLAVQGAMDY
ncbi:MAG: nuclear transport factor 2 family protein [Proteobacteria bacterium]|nr:nuclear transport factor 2 family protein [Pseudomonadota bacterium]